MYYISILDHRHLRMKLRFWTPKKKTGDFIRNASYNTIGWKKLRNTSELIRGITVRNPLFWGYFMSQESKPTN